jgi:hypothetical protein
MSFGLSVTLMHESPMFMIGDILMTDQLKGISTDPYEERSTLCLSL